MRQDALPFRILKPLLPLLLVALSACSFVADSSPPPVPVPEAFSFKGQANLPDQWWTALEDRDLDALVERALAENLSLQSTWDRLDQARAAARKAGADRYPSMTAEAGVSRTWIDDAGNTSDLSSRSLGLVAAYELDLWGRIRSSRDAARLDAEASAEDLAAAGISLSAGVATTWYQLIEQRGQKLLLEQQRDTNQKVLELLSLQFRTGRIGIADVLQQRQLVEANRGELTQVLARIQLLEHQLSILLGQAPGQSLSQSYFPQRVELVELPPLPATGVPAELIERRPDVRRAFLRMRAADHRVASAVADRFPQLSLTGRFDTEAGTSRDLFDDWLASLAAGLTGPVLDGGRRRAEVDRTRAVAAEALHDYGQVVLEALGEVEDALVQEHQQRHYVASLERQLELSSQSIERIRDRYLKGNEDYQRVLSALLSSQSLQRRELTARREMIAFRIALCRALSSGWVMKRSNPER